MTRLSACGSVESSDRLETRAVLPLQAVGRGNQLLLQQARDVPAGVVVRAVRNAEAPRMLEQPVPGERMTE